MTKNKFFIYFCVLILVLVSFSFNSNPTTKEGQKPDQPTVNTAVQDNGIISDTSEKKNDTLLNYSQKETKQEVIFPFLSQETIQSYSLILLYISLGCSIIAIVLAIYLLRITLKIRRWLKSDKFKDYIVERVIIDSYKNSGKIFRLIDNHPQKNNSQSSLSDRSAEAIVNRSIDKNIYVIANRVLECINTNKKEDRTVVSPPLPRVNNFGRSTSTANTSHLYASSADSNKNSFFKITTQPDEDTIYKLFVSGERSKFIIYDGAFRKVLKAPDFLECACEVQKTGNQTVTTAEQGIAERTPDGTWRITTKAKIKFE